jgi:hypothetical protein
LWANLIYTLATQPVLFFFGRTSTAYEIAYYGFAALHFAGALNVAREQLAKRWHLALGILAAGAVIWRAYAGFTKPLEPYQWYALVEGGALALAGTVTAYAAARNKLAGILLTLSGLWLALAWFRLGFALTATAEIWQRLNYVLPTVFVCGALGWVGIKLLEGRPANA